MLRRLTIAAVVVAFAAFGVIAGEFKGAIVKYEAGKSLTLKTKDGEKVLKISKDVKVAPGKDGKEVDIAKRLEKAGDKGVFAAVTTNDKDEVVEIKTGAGKKKDSK